MGLNKIDAKVDDSVQRREISDNVISFAELALDPNVEAIRGAIEVKLAGFERHMPALLDILRSANRCRSAPGSFDSATVGRRLHGIAEFYFWRGAVKAVSASAPKSRLRTLKKTLAAACALIDETLQSDAGDDLCWAWWEAQSEYSETAGNFVDLLYIERGFKEAVAELVTLQTAASRVADKPPMKQEGRPTVLPQDLVVSLAHLYREATERKPGAGPGPFARFVAEFLEAIGLRDIASATVIDAIKRARERDLKCPTAARWAPSPFGEDA